MIFLVSCKCIFPFLDNEYIFLEDGNENEVYARKYCEKQLIYFGVFFVPLCYHGKKMDLIPLFTVQLNDIGVTSFTGFLRRNKATEKAGAESTFFF